MNLNQKKTGYTGDVFFYRAGDIHDNLYEENDQEIYDTFLDDGYSPNEAWDTLVWYLDVEISQQGGSGSLSIKDHQGASPLTRAWGAGATEKGSFGTIPSNSGDHSITVTLRGQDSFVHLKVAGALVRSWTLWGVDLPTLIMMHGMTGDASMMRPFAEKILPEGWTLLVPEARFSHPNRGYTWWRYEDFEADVTRRMSLSRKELMDVDSSLSQLEKLIAEEAPLGPLVVGGFSQGGAMAQELLQLPIADRIQGVVCMGTRLVRPMELRLRLSELENQRLFWMHGEKDLRVPIEDGWAIAHLFESAGWAVELIEHPKGHMIPTEHHQALKEWLMTFSWGIGWSRQTHQ